MSSYYTASPPPPPPPGVPPAVQEFCPPPPAEHEEISPVDGATEHVLLSPYDLPELRRRGQPNAQTLHDEARHWTNHFAGVQSAEVQADLTAQWENWKVYIAKHKSADAIVGPGVVSFTAEFIEGTVDPNRGGNPRLDLVIRHSDGGYVRLHPGPKAKHDAIPRFFPGSAAVSAAEHAPRFSPSSAPEHAAYEWRTPGAGGVFTAARANLVPQVDKLGKEDIWRTVQTLMAQGLIANERDGPWVDITDGTHLRWWLWICNLATYTNTVIGTGVRSAHVAMNMDHEAVFKFVRADESECILRLCCINRGRGRELRMYM